MDESLLAQIVIVASMACAVHVVNGLLGIFFNTLLIYLAAKESPKAFRAYSTLILSSAVCNLCTSCADIFTQQRMIPRALSLFYISYGPCCIFGSSTCFIGFSFLLHCYIFGLYLTLLSFVFRYYVLYHNSPRIRTTLATIFLFYMPCLLQCVLFGLSSDSEQTVREELNRYFHYDTTDNCVSGHLSILKFGVLYMAVHQDIPVIPVYAFILILRKRIVTKLRTMKTISEKTRQMHSMLLKAIVYQACIPCFYSLTAATYVIGQLDIIHHPYIEIITLTFVSFIPVLTPLASLYFIKPYRTWLLENILMRKPSLSTRTIAFTSTVAG